MSVKPTPEALTLRKLIELVGVDFMDAELCVQVRDPYQNHIWSALPISLSNMPRYLPRPGTGEAGRITLQVYVSEHRFVKIKKPAPTRI